jgi:hypothetical protein
VPVATPINGSSSSSSSTPSNGSAPGKSADGAITVKGVKQSS